MVRGSLTLGVIGLLYLAADLVQRLVVAPLVRLRPVSRNRILAKWARFMTSSTFTTLRWVGGARIDVLARIPARPGVLILMNHQSLMDIPIVFKSLEGGHVRIVTRRRYARGIPLVSHMLRLYEHPLVEPGRTSREDVAALAEIARTSEQPVALFPEGHRTRDGEIRPFKRTGVRAILGSRPWTVYVLVVDGLWTCAQLPDFLRGVGSVRARAESLGPFDYPGPGGDADAFLDDVSARMSTKLKEIRESLG